MLDLRIILELLFSKKCGDEKKLPIIENQTEYDIEEKNKVLSIANGTKNGIGPVSKFDVEEEDSELKSYWTAGGSDHTHQFLVASGILILENDRRLTNFYTKGGATTIIEYADKPDEDDVGIAFASHFWDPDSDKNYLGLSSPTAKTRFIENYNVATCVYQSNKQQAYQYLGRAMHYLSDLGQPHHSSNQITGLTNHKQYEYYVDERRTEYRIESSDKYLMCTHRSLMFIIKQVASFSKSFKESVGDSKNWDAIGPETIANTQKYVAGILYRFLMDVGEIPKV